MHKKCLYNTSQNMDQNENFHNFKKPYIFILVFSFFLKTLELIQKDRYNFYTKSLYLL